VVRSFMARYPNVRLSLHQGNPHQVCEYVLSGEADIAIATEAIAEHEDLVMLPCYQWNRCIIAPVRHPILSTQPLTLEAIARYPMSPTTSPSPGATRSTKPSWGAGSSPMWC
jgi:LysR family cys regulon transcriptional activator